MRRSECYRRRVYNFLELGSFGGFWGGIFDGFMVILILANVLAVALETVESLYAVYAVWFQYFEVFSITLFTIEYVMRVWSCVEREEFPETRPVRSRSLYMFTPLALIDLIAILPFHLLFAGSADLRFLRLFRLLRIFKLLRYSPGLYTLGRVIYAEHRALMAAFLVMVGLMFFAASLMYLVERNVQPDAFGSIPDALWWALATLTTVGYGDVVPVTPFGKLLGGFVMIFGLAFYAIPIGVIASGFSDEIHRREFSVPNAVIAKADLFRGMPTDVRTSVTPRLRNMMVAAGTVITHRRDENNGLYILVSGEASAFYHQRAIPMVSGDLLGEFGIVIEDGHQPSIVTRTRCSLLWLESADLHVLMSMWHEVTDRISTYSKKRYTELTEEGYLSTTESTEMEAILDAWLPKKIEVQPEP